MKVVILAGGLGTRISEESHLKPKPMIEIGEHPILWHIMKIYSHYGHNDFIICLGYKGYVIKEYFANYFLHNSDVTFDISNNKVEIHSSFSEPWKVTLIDTGLNTGTGGRIKKAGKYLNNEPFFLTYGDGVADININSLLAFHKKHNKLVTITAVQPEGRFGTLEINNDNIVNSFVEKPVGDNAWINGGFFLCQKECLNYISDYSTLWEKAPLEIIANNKELAAFKHMGFWQCLDTGRDLQKLNEKWKSETAPWKVWK